MDAVRPRHPEKLDRPDSPIQRKPAWIRVKAPISRNISETRALMRRLDLHTVCEEAACPNIGECWKQEARDDDDPGQRLHPGLRLLQRRDRHARQARSP